MDTGRSADKAAAAIVGNGQIAPHREQTIEPRMTRNTRLEIPVGKLIHEELSRSIIGAAMTVLNELKPGLDEKIYENALVLELVARGHVVKQQDQFPVYYREQKVGVLIPDLIVDNLVIADPKVVSTFSESHVAKMVGYLAITNLQLALLLNFKCAKLDVKRVVRQHHFINGPSSDAIDVS